MHKRRWGIVREMLGTVLLAVLAAAAPASAQVEIGENLKMNMNGTLGFGYSGELGNSLLGSSHGTFISGNGTLSGSYYHPNFLSFNIEPFYNRNQDNSSFQSVNSDTGITASVNLFGGSHFPGAISYGRSSLNGSQYGLPGEIGLDSDTSTQTFSVTWSALFPKWPTLTASFSDSSTSQTILGENGSVDSGVRSFILTSNYRLAGFSLSGVLNHQNFNTDFPAFLTGKILESNSSNTSYSLSATHQLPLSGSFSAGFTHASYDSESNAVENSGSTNTLYSTVSLVPARKLSVSGSFRYNDNLIGVLQQSTFTNGALPVAAVDLGGHGINLNGYASYGLGHGFLISGYVNRNMQHYQESDYSNTQFGATLTYNYARPLLGMLYFSFGMVNNTTDGSQGNMALVGSLGLKKQVRGWDINADVSYAQNVQSSFELYTTSNYNFGAFVRKRFGADTYFTASARNVSTGLTQLAGYSNRAETFLVTLTRKRYGISGSYGMSHGTSVLTTAGILAPTPLAPLLSPDEVIYNGKTYGVGFNVVPVKRMIINVNWYKTQSDTLSPVLFSNNGNTRLYGNLTYNLRKLQFRATYWRVNQLISASGLPVANQNSYSFTVSRWFHLF